MALKNIAGYFVLLLIGAGVGFFIFRSGGIHLSKPNPQPPIEAPTPRAKATDFATYINFLPDNCRTLVSMDMDAIFRSKAVLRKMAKQNLKDEEDADLKDYTGIPKSNIKHIIIAGLAAEDRNPLLIIQTKTPITPNEIVAAKKHDQIGEMRIGSRAYCEDKHYAFCPINSHAIAFGRKEHIRDILRRNGPPALSAGFQAALGTVQLFGHATVIFDSREIEEYDRIPYKSLLGMQIVKPILQKSKSAKLEYRIDESAQIDVTVEYKDEADARDAKKVADAFQVLTARAEKGEKGAIKAITDTVIPELSQILGQNRGGDSL